MANWPQHLLTAEAFAAMTQDDDWQEEVIDGVLYRFPPPFARHGIICGNVAGVIWEAVKPTGFGRVSIGSGLVVARDPDSVLGPDIQVFSAGRPPNNPRGWPTVPPVLVAEVVNDPADYFHVLAKVPLYLGYGVDLVWVVRPQLQDVHVYRLADQPRPFDRWRWIDRGSDVFTRLAADATLDGGDVLPGFSCKVADLFA
jgi:Uma2 family endonuclease